MGNYVSMFDSGHQQMYSQAMFNMYTTSEVKKLLANITILNGEYDCIQI